METQALDLLSGIIRGRRSVKPAALDPQREVPEPLVETLLENACWAPTHGLTEPWRFVVHVGEARRRLCELMPRVYDAVTPAGAVRPEKREKLGQVFLLAPVVIQILMARDASGRVPELEEVMAVACAVQNLHLSATAAGLAGMWSTPPALYDPRAASLLGLEPGERCLGFFFLGWPKEETSPQGRRAPLAQKVRWRRQGP